MNGLIINPNSANDAAGRELQRAMGELINAWVQRFPALAGHAAKGFKIRITVSDGTAWEANGGAAPVQPFTGIR